MAIQADVSKLDEVQQLFKKSSEAFGTLDVLVNNAAISPKKPDGARLNTIETVEDDWKTIFQVNFFAPLVLARGLSAFSPWAMGLTFGVGQLLAAAVLYWNLERRHGGQ